MENKEDQEKVKGINSFKVTTYYHRNLAKKDKLRDKFKFPSKVAFQQGCVVINTNNRLGIRESIKVMFGTNKTKDQAEEEALKLSGMKFVKLGKEKEFAEQQYKQQTEKDDLLE